MQAALLAYEVHGAVHVETGRDYAIAVLVDDYVADVKLNGSTASRLALAHRRKDVYAIKQAVKCTLREMQEPKTELLILTEHGLRAFGEGVRILFMRNDVTLGVRNGMLGTITKVGDDQLIVALDPDDAEIRRTVTFDPKICPSIDHGFAVSIHRAQGCTVDRSFVLSSTTLDNSLAYVAMTRHRKEAGFYTAPDIRHQQYDGRLRDQCSPASFNVPAAGSKITGSMRSQLAIYSRWSQTICQPESNMLRPPARAQRYISAPFHRPVKPLVTTGALLASGP